MKWKIIARLCLFFSVFAGGWMEYDTIKYIHSILSSPSLFRLLLSAFGCVACAVVVAIEVVMVKELRENLGISPLLGYILIAIITIIAAIATVVLE